jgi:hypothetical protein
LVRNRSIVSCPQNNMPSRWVGPFEAATMRFRLASFHVVAAVTRAPISRGRSRKLLISNLTQRKRHDKTVDFRISYSSHSNVLLLVIGKLDVKWCGSDGRAWLGGAGTIAQGSTVGHRRLGAMETRHRRSDHRRRGEIAPRAGHVEHLAASTTNQTAGESPFLVPVTGCESCRRLRSSLACRSFRNESPLSRWKQTHRLLGGCTLSRS